MAQAFTHEDAAFLLRMDAFYEELHASNRITWTPLRSEAFHSSGLSDLFAAVAHFIKEIRIGTMHETRQGLQRAIGDGPVSYYQVIGHPRQAVVDAALDSFTTLEEKENPFLAQYQERVVRALETQFSEEVALRFTVRWDRADSFRSMVTSFAEFLKVHVEATGQFPALALTSPTPAPPELDSIELARGGSRLTFGRDPTEPSHENPPYLFRREGDVWRIRFRGNPSTVKHRTGLSYIAELLRHRGEELPALALYYAVNGTRTGVSSLFAPSEPQIQDASSGTHETRSSLAPAQARAAAIHEELKDAQEAQDEEREEELLRELEAIHDRLAQQERGDKRVEPDPALERARLSVRQNISRAFVALAPHDEALVSFLRRAIRTGHSCSYLPTDPVPWDF
jgi:hypothetical protein